jgi:hypothetical protein
MDDIMNTTHHRKKRLVTLALGAAATAVAVPVLVFYEAGIAHAQSAISFANWPGNTGVTVSYTDFTGQPANDCTYRAVPHL